MIIKHDEDAYLDVDAIRAIYTDYIGEVKFYHVCFDGHSIQVTKEQYERIFDAFWLRCRHMCYDFSDKNSPSYQKDGMTL